MNEEDEIELLLKSQNLKSPSKSLDNSILALLEKPQEEIPQPKKIRWIPILSLAAVLLLVVNLSFQIVKQNTPVDTDVKSIDSLKVKKKSPSVLLESVDHQHDFYKGDTFKLEDGRMIKPVMHTDTVKKVFIDERDNIKVIIEEPQHELYYIDMNID